MRTLILEVLLAAIAVCGIPASAQQTGKPEAPSSPQHSGDVDANSQGLAQHSAQPSAELQKLIKALSGNWTLDEKLEPSPGMPNGLTRSSEETWRSGPGGFTLIEDEGLPTSAGDVFLLGVIWWDNRTPSFVAPFNETNRSPGYWPSTLRNWC